MLPRINTNSSTKKLISPKSNPNFDIKEETINLALNVINLDRKSYNVLDYDDLKHYKVTNEVTVQALGILLYYKKIA
jgi:hypothetical protein